MGSDTGSADDTAIHIVIDHPLRNTCARHISENMGNQSAERNREFFDSLYTRLRLSEVSNINDYNRFLLIRKISKMLELVLLIKRQNNSDHNVYEFLRSVTKAADRLYKHTVGRVINYLKSNKEAIFSENQPDCELKSASLDFIIECKTGIDDYPLYKYLCRNCPHLIICRFDELSYVFKKYKDLFLELFPSGRIDLQNKREAQVILKIWTKEYCKQDSQFRHSAEKYAAELYQDAETLGEKLSFDNVIETDTLIESIGSFLNEVQTPKANSFAKYLGRAENLKRQCFYNNVTILSDVLKFPSVEYWKTHDQKLLYLTHLDTVSSKNISYLSLVKEASSNKNGYCGEITSFRDADLMELYKTIIFLQILGDKTALDDYSRLVIRAVHDISVKISQKKGELEKDTGLLLGMLRSVAKNIDEPGQEQKIYCYSSSVFLCSLTDKLLRLFYLCLKKDKEYIPAGITTLGRLLNENNKDFEKVFGSDHLFLLAYFLVTVTGAQQGKNYRNSLAHWASGMSPDDMNPILTASLMWIFSDVLNSVHLYFDSQAKEDPAADKSEDSHD